MEYLGHEREEQEGYHAPSRLRIHYRCLRCGHEYSRIAKSLSVPDAPCPLKACKAIEAARAAENIARVVESRTAPGIIGDKPIVGVIDSVATQVMEDYKMTNLRDDVRMGETMAPKLPGKMQQAADNYFAPGAGLTGMNPKQAQLIAKRALSGAYRSMAVAPMDVFPGQPGESALRRIGTST
jgi:hypothetical protein